MRRIIVRLLATVGAVTIVCLLLAAVALLFAPRLLVTGDKPAPADGIVVMGGGLGRAIFAAGLYAKGLAPRVYVCRPQVGKGREMFKAYGLEFPLEEEINLRMLTQDGVPPEAVTVYGHYVLSTVEEAESLRAAIPDTPRRLILVTSPYHTRRAKLIFESVFPETEILSVGTPGDPVPEAWWRDRHASLMVVTELAKLVWWGAGGAFRSHGVQGARGHG